jgi:hypothetical protein
MKHKKSKRQKDNETLTRVRKEMAQPRFAESARRELQVANDEGTERAGGHRAVIPVR